MSNLIKAYNIRYKNEKRTIDLNPLADLKQQKYIEQLNESNPVSQTDISSKELNLLEEANENSEDGFVAGFGSLPVFEDAEEINIDEKQMEALLEPRNDNNQLELESKLLLQQTKEEAEKILLTAEADAQLKKQSILNEARSEGYEIGYSEAKQELETMKQELREEKKQLEIDFEKHVKALEPAFVDLVIGLVQKLTGMLVEEKKEIIEHLIHQAMTKYDSSNSYIIRVSQDDFAYVNSLKKAIRMSLKENCVVEIIADKMLQKAQCMIETDTRIIDCSLDTQLKSLIFDLKLLAGGEHGETNA